MGDEEDQDEPVAEPEPSHHNGDPRTHAFHSWLYQKIDPKVRAARRKKFFGSGRRRRAVDDDDDEEEDISDDILLEVFNSEDTRGRNFDPIRKGRADGTLRNNDSRFHAFHAWLHTPIDATARRARRQKLWRDYHSKSERHSITKRSAPPAAEGISINLGV